jgi:hypothetical protein
VASSLYHSLERSGSWIIVGTYKNYKIVSNQRNCSCLRSSAFTIMWRLAHYLRLEWVSLLDHISRVAVTGVWVLLFFWLS